MKLKFLILLTAALGACGSTAEKNGSSTESASTRTSFQNKTGGAFDDNFKAIATNIRDFYNGVVFGERPQFDDKDFIYQNCTMRFVEKLETGYRDQYEGEGYAYWYLRGPFTKTSDKDKVLNFRKAEGNSVIIKYLDNGHECETEIQMKIEDGVWKINDAKLVSVEMTPSVPEV